VGYTPHLEDSRFWEPSMDAATGAVPAWSAFARQVVDRAVRKADPQGIPVPTASARDHGGVFVTLHKFKRLRGCMGTLDTTRPVGEAVRHAAVSAALHDPRFPPVGVAELPDLVIEVSILSPPWPMRSLEELELGRHGVLVRCGLRQGLFLPQVATEHRLDREALLSRCCSEKAGLPPEAWRDPDTDVLLFTTEVFAEGGRGDV
jgi:AmmeMemoRadiSam system protein A